MPTGGTQNIDNNSIVTAFNKTGAGGTITLLTTNASSPAGTTNNSNNNFSNITVTGATTIAGSAITMVVPLLRLFKIIHSVTGLVVHPV